MQKNYSFADKIILELDRSLKVLANSSSSHAQRDNPASTVAEPELTLQQRQTSARLMRVNHAGEMAAQGLYHGQALTARNSDTLARMQASAQEETDHLVWCQQRLNELDSHSSLINPLWYMGSFAMGVTAGLCGDKWSLGFVSETEKQVEEHLSEHLQRLPAEDSKSRSILKQMQQDEIEHGEAARNLGGVDLPKPIPQLMRSVSQIMKVGAYWI